MVTRTLALVVFTGIGTLLALQASAKKEPPAKTREFFVSGPAGKLHALDTGGGGLPIVFIPSLAGTVRQWQAQVDHVRQQHRAVVVELRGHGKSEGPRDHDYSLAAMASDVDAVVTSLHLKRFVLAGHSMGGGVALAYAAAHPDRVACLLLADPLDDPHARPRDALKGFIEPLDSGNYATEVEVYWNRILDGARPEVKEIVLADLRGTPRETVLGTIRASTDFNASAALAKYQGPVISVVTRFNNIPSALHKVSPRVRGILLEHTSHWLQMDDPVAFNRLMDDFVAGVH